MRILLATLASVIGISLTSYAQDSQQGMTLSQAISAVLERYPSLDAAKAEIDAANGRTTQSESERLLHVSVNAQYAYLSLRPHIAIPSFPSLYESVSNSYNAGITAQQLLCDFGRTDAIIALAHSGEISARDALEQAQHQLGYEVIQNFYNVLLLRSSVNVADEEIKALEEAQRVSEQKLGGGTATHFDVLSTQVRLANARNQKTSLVASLEKQESRFRQLLGLDPQAPIFLSGSFNSNLSTPNLAESIAEGIANRPEMKLAKDYASSATIKLDVANKNNRPVLNATGAALLQDNQMPSLYSNRTYFEGGINLSVPILTGKRLEGEKIEARAQLRAAEAKVSELNRVIATDVSDAISDLKAALSRIESADMLVKEAEEALVLAKSRYENGVITTFELLDAQSNARAAELSRLQSRYDCTIAQKALERAIGLAPKA